MRREVKKTIHNGNLTITNVPHLVDDERPYDCSEVINGSVMYKMAYLFQYMLAKKITEIEYSEDTIKEAMKHEQRRA